MKKPRHLLIDGDILVYQHSSSQQTTINWGGDSEPSVCTFDARAERDILDKVARYKEKLRASDVLVCLSDPKKNWRKEILPTYKANRKGTERPLLYDEMRKVLVKNYPSLCLPWLEADDLMGLLATDPHFNKTYPGEKIIVSIDKDMKTIPGKLYQPNKPDLGVQTISPQEAHLNHFKQILMGDVADGYYGVKGIGPKKAEKILTEAGDKIEDQWKAILLAYRSAGLSVQDALLTARVSRIIQKGEYDMKTKKVFLWNPPKIS